MSEESIRFNQATFETKLDSMVRDKVEQIVNAMLDEKADRIANAARYREATDAGRARPATTCGNYWQRRYACTMDTSLGHQAIGSSACARRVFNRAFC